MVRARVVYLYVYYTFRHASAWRGLAALIPGAAEALNDVGREVVGMGLELGPVEAVGNGKGIFLPLGYF
jgi:hypothetical protein